MGMSALPSDRSCITPNRIKSVWGRQNLPRETRPAFYRGRSLSANVRVADGVFDKLRARSSVIAFSARSCNNAAAFNTDSLPDYAGLSGVGSRSSARTPSSSPSG